MKKLFAILLAVALMATMSITTFAAENTTEVSFEVQPTYTITIPTTVSLEKKVVEGVTTYENDYTITAEAGVRLKKGETIEVTVASDYKMETTEGAELTYTITKDGKALENAVVAVFGTDKAAQTSTIHIAAQDPDFAGNYKDTVTFTIAVVTTNN